MTAIPKNPTYESAKRGGLLVDQVHDQVCHAILSGNYAPAERVNIRRLASGMAVSVTPVREALSRLISDGILCTNEKRAVLVPKLQVAEVDEIFHIRRLLEGDLAKTAAGHMRDEDIEFLAQTQTLFLDALATRNYRDVLKYNSQFHFRIYERAGMYVTFRIVENLWLRIGPTLHFMYPILARDRSGNHSHENIIDKARRHDGAALRAAVLEDLQNSLSALHQYLEHGAERGLRARNPAAKTLSASAGS
jgi:DNA-binding GntR family transcriptional regulator